VPLARSATDDYLAKMGRQLDITFDCDLGELVEGHHVVLRGIELGRPIEVNRWVREQERLAQERVRQAIERGDFDGGGFFSSGGPLSERDKEVVETRSTEAELHYEFVPGLASDERQSKGGFFWYWMLHCSDDIGTEYSDNNSGGVGPQVGGAATHAFRDLGGQVPPEATRLIITFEPPTGWEPPEPWRRRIEVDLVARVLVEP